VLTSWLVVWRQNTGRAKRDMDMEVVFQPGLEGLGERLLAGKRGKAGRNSETVWDAYMRKRKCVQLYKRSCPGQTRPTWDIELVTALKPDTRCLSGGDHGQLRTFVLQREAGSCQGQGSCGSLGVGGQRPRRGVTARPGRRARWPRPLLPAGRPRVRRPLVCLGAHNGLKRSMRHMRGHLHLDGSSVRQRALLSICVSHVPHATQNDGEAADGEHAVAAAAANGDKKADRAKSKKLEAARAATKEAAAEQERRKAELEMLMMPDAELRNAGELLVVLCSQAPSAFNVAHRCD